LREREAEHAKVFEEATQRQKVPQLLVSRVSASFLRSVLFLYLSLTKKKSNNNIFRTGAARRGSAAAGECRRILTVLLG
jgi:hypothetical protein